MPAKVQEEYRPASNGSTNLLDLNLVIRLLDPIS
jgi:hypothetical protein